MSFWIYNAALLLFSPVLVVWLLFRLFVRGKSRGGWQERLGKAPIFGEPDGPIWLHAVSAGEMAAAAPVARALWRRAPEAAIVVSTITPAGLAQAKRLLPEAAAFFYFPLDFLPCVTRALSRVRPALFVAVETELWPNFLKAAASRGVPTAIVNGRFSDRTLRRLFGPACWLRPLFAATLALVDRLAMQTKTDAERAVALGARPERVSVCGNTKFDQTIRCFTPEELAQLRAGFALRERQPLWIAGSTHPGEEEQLLDVWQRLRVEIPELALMIAPRHVERAPMVERLCRERTGAACRIVRRSLLLRAEGLTAEVFDGSTPTIVILDTLGELAAIYALATAVFVGGSLVPVGGHDVLQPLYHGKPTFFGPYMHNQRDLAALVLEAGAARQVSDPAALTAGLREVLKQPERAAALAEAAAGLLATHQGAADRCADVILELLRDRRCGVWRDAGETPALPATPLASTEGTCEHATNNRPRRASAHPSGAVVGDR